jgi:hypothetical protein
MLGRPPPINSKVLGFSRLGVVARSGWASACRSAEVRFDVWFCGECEP